MATILVVDDELPLLALVSSYLQRNGYQVVTATRGAEALKLAYQLQPDLGLLDVLIPEMDGVTLCRRLRAMTNMPIIMLTALDAEPRGVEALEAGADDYITKPFGCEELLARIKAAMRRGGLGKRERPEVVIAGDVMIFLARREVTVAGQVVALTSTEFNLLACLAKEQGQVVPHRKLLQEVWGAEYIDQLAYLSVYIRHLRRKIETDPAHPRILLTRRGAGYSLAET